MLLASRVSSPDVKHAESRGIGQKLIVSFCAADLGPYRSSEARAADPTEARAADPTEVRDSKHPRTQAVLSFSDGTDVDINFRILVLYVESTLQNQTMPSRAVTVELPPRGLRKRHQCHITDIVRLAHRYQKPLTLVIPHGTDPDLLAELFSKLNSEHSQNVTLSTSDLQLAKSLVEKSGSENDPLNGIGVQYRGSDCYAVSYDDEIGEDSPVVYQHRTTEITPKAISDAGVKHAIFHAGDARIQRMLSFYRSINVAVFVEATNEANLMKELETKLNEDSRLEYVESYMNPVNGAILTDCLKQWEQRLENAVKSFEEKCIEEALEEVRLCEATVEYLKRLIDN